MNKYKKPVFKEKDLGINPCTYTLQILVNKLEFENQYKLDSEGDLLPVEKEVEATPYGKIYITSERRKIVSNLSPAAKEVYLWIMFEVKAGNDYLWLNKYRFMEENNTSLNTYKKGVEELIRYALIAFTVVKDVYWINSDFFFHGDRIKKYPKNVILN